MISFYDSQVPLGTKSSSLVNSEGFTLNNVKKQQ